MGAPVVITGGSSGIGRAIEVRLRSAGYQTLNLDIVPSTDDTLDYIHCDLNDPEQIANAIDHIPPEIAGLICVAGVGSSDDPAKIVRINFLGTRCLTDSLMLRVRAGSGITLIASSAGRDWSENRRQVDALLGTDTFTAGVDWLVENHSKWSDQAYKFSKQCLAAYTYHAAGKALELGLRVNCINPGITDTRLSAGFRQLLGPDNYDRITRLTGRAGQPEDIAGLAEFLTLGDAHWINGVEITVDGGYHAGMIAGWHKE